MIEIKTSKEYGRGCYAKEDINPFKIIETCELLILNPKDTKIANDFTQLEFYTFKLDNERDCIVLGNGELFNHSNCANIMYTVAWIDERQVMIFVSTKKIKKGEQLFIDYSADCEVNVNSYVNQNMI